MALPRETSRLAKALESIPTLPTVAHRLNEVIQSSSATVPQVAEILRGDPATSAKLLRLVNSPHFGVPGGVADVARAIPFVGFNQLYQLVLSIGVMDVVGAAAGLFDPRELWMHSLTVATAARQIACEVKFPDPGSAFTAGLLHDIGKIALAKLEPDRLATAITLMRDERVDILDAEARCELTSHEWLGGRLAQLWRFPAKLAGAIEHHHAVCVPERAAQIPAALRPLAEIVAAADHLAHDIAGATGDAFADDGDPRARGLLERSGVGADRIDAVVDSVRKHLERSKAFASLG
jgi:putative nucleotidyltransferase with HDIG domain